MKTSTVLALALAAGGRAAGAGVAVRRAAQLNAQFADQGHDFLNNPAKNKISPAAARLSKYFDWHTGDWEQNGQSVVQWVNRYSVVKINDATRISYLDYNWGLNKQ